MLLRYETCHANGSLCLLRDLPSPYAVAPIAALTHDGPLMEVGALARVGESGRRDVHEQASEQLAGVEGLAAA